MFTRKTEKSQLEETIELLNADLENLSVSDEDRSAIIDQVIALHKLTPSKRVSPDAMATIAGNLVGILMILSHERAHVITSKALSFVGKLK